ncbi:MAG: Rrf2 family transcriptional regulator [Candidatus Abyssubacteria bacterium]|nr:Rrf2 family transcriptional regulator [Candidatus Abyssubacteria bacterium]
MKVSAKGDYACRALLELALRFDSTSPVHVREIAKKQRIPQKYLVQILVMLKSAGLVRSKRGADGGYLLSRPPSEITLGEVIRLVDGPLLPVKCSSEDVTATCELIPTCAIHPVWEDVREAISDIVDNITYEDLCRRTHEMAEMYYI